MNLSGVHEVNENKMILFRLQNTVKDGRNQVGIAKLTFNFDAYKISEDTSVGKYSHFHFIPPFVLSVIIVVEVEKLNCTCPKYSEHFLNKGLIVKIHKSGLCDAAVEIRTS